MRRLLLPILALFLFAAAPLRADTFEDSVEAMIRGDYATAAKLLQPLAERGNADAQYSLGGLHEMGKGVPQNYVRAYVWYTLAAAKGDVDSVNARNEITAKMTPAQLEEAKRLAREWKPNTGQ